MEVTNNTRLLKLRDILFEETDENNELSITEIEDKLKLHFGTDASFDPRTLKRDIEILEESGVDIARNKGKYGKVYYSYQDHLFETYQLRFINDAVLSAKFITEKEKKTLIQKTKQMTSRHIAKTLPDPVLFSQSSNEDYQLVKLNIDYIHRAISEQKVLQYHYGRYNLKKEFEFSRNGDLYEVEPYALIWQSDYYYLIGKFRGNGEMRHYRLDRMRHMDMKEERFRRDAFTIQDYVDQSFHMFTGEDSRIKIEFDASLLNVVIDRFGIDASITPVTDERFILSTQAKISRGLINWILTWGAKAKVLSPDKLVEDIKQEVEHMYKHYQ